MNKAPRERKYGLDGTRPIQALSYSEKMAKDGQWVKDNIDFYIDQSNFGKINKAVKGKEEQLSKQQLYDLYNNKIDEKIFGYVTNPLNTKNPNFKSFPAKLRSYNIIRPNIDLLLGEWNRKLYSYDVLNMDGEEVLNTFNAYQTAVFAANLEQRFVNEYNKIKQTVLPTIDIPDPKDVITDLHASYKDLKAIRGYRALKVLEFEIKLKQIFKKLFKDWLIAGDCYSLKFVNHNSIDYRKLSTLAVGAELGGENLVEDGEWATAWFRPSVSEVVDLFYDTLSKEDLDKLERGDTLGNSRLTFWNSLIAASKGTDGLTNRCDLYYSCWKSRRKVQIISSIDPMTNETVFDEVDETYQVDTEAGEKLEDTIWLNEVWGGWRINQDTYLNYGPEEVQRYEMDNLSKCKLPINGARFSDTESDNISITQLGVPYQIMYIVLMFRTELAIAKSKGIVQFLDRNTIPDGSTDEGEEEFLYRAEALGFALLDWTGEGANRTFNQFPHVDFSQLKTIGELRDIALWFKDQWDELVGINRQRKGQSNSRDGLGVTQESIFRSSVISDIVFDGFDDFIESELQGLLDLSKYAWIDGKSSYYGNEDGTLEFFDIDPLDHASSSYKVFVDFKGRNKQKMEMLQQQVNAIAQRKDVKLSVLADMIFTDSYAELKAMLKKAESVEARFIQEQAASQQEQIALAEEMKREYMIFENMLQVDFMEREADRLDNREFIKGLIDQMKASEGGLDMGQVEEQANKHLERMSKERLELRKIQSNEKIATMKDLTERFKAKVSLKNKVAGEK